mgnify:FL=1
MKKIINKKLSDLSFEVTQNSSTEPAFSGEYYSNKREGLYNCICCDENLFHSNDKYDSGSGWPSFTKAINYSKIRLIEDNSFGMKRVEVKCFNCDSHLGHVFDDGPKPDGKRYCINSVSLNFVCKNGEL